MTTNQDDFYNFPLPTKTAVEIEGWTIDVEHCAVTNQWSGVIRDRVITHENLADYRRVLWLAIQRVRGY